MKITPAHLPDDKQQELKRIVSVVRDRCGDVEMIVLFGSYARGDYKEEADLKPERKSGHKSDYDILVVTGEKKTAIDVGLWKTVGKECDNAGLSTHVRIVAHDIQELNIKLAEGQYFFSDAIEEGCLLYDSGRFKLARKRKLKPEEEQRIAQDYFDHWFEKASFFFEDYKANFRKGLQVQNYFSQAAFYLHQATESALKTICLVFTHYNPNEHLLGLLCHMAAEHEAALNNIFPQETKEEEERFKLLDYAYIGARYDPDYRIGKEDLELLSARVKLLLDLTEKICKAKIESLLSE